MILTKQQQNELAVQLDSLFNTVYLRCDDYLVSAGLVRYKNKLVIDVYVNGHFKGKWLVFDTLPEETRRFLRPSVRNKWDTKFIKGMEKILGKRECKKNGYYDKCTTYHPYWLRPRPFLRHLMKYNQSIDVLDYATYKAAIEVLPKDED